MRNSLEQATTARRSWSSRFLRFTNEELDGSLDRGGAGCIIQKRSRGDVVAGNSIHATITEREEAPGQTKPIWGR